MGPTGSGKTTLLDVLAGRTELDGIDGHVLIDSAKPPKNFKCMTGYVVQDDVVMGTLTIRENFMFSANLRLPKNIGHKEKKQRVEDTIQELGLVKCADSKVGTEFIRGVSGGERKRTNIGMELIIKPAILFLDEPTTGLDASTANAVMSLLHSLSKRNRTIIFSIHQPRYTIFKLFDRLTLLAAGRTAYHGPASEALDHFASIGYECEEHNNPPDFFLDVINGDSTAVQAVNADAMKHGLENGVNGVNGVVPEVKVISNGKSDSAAMEMEELERGKSPSLAEEISRKYHSSPTFSRLQAELSPIMADYERNKKNGGGQSRVVAQYATNAFSQFRHLSVRMVKNLVRNPMASFLQIFIAMFMGVIVGVIYLQLGLNYPAGVQNRVGALFFIIQNQIFSNMSAVELFINERVIFVHECASGFYRVSSYFFAKIFCDLLPMRLLPLCGFAVITYFMIGLQIDVAKFFIFFLTLFLTTLCGTAVCFTISASVRVFAIANLFCILVFIMMMIFGGLLVNIASLPVWLRWVQYLSVFRYSLNMLTINEMTGLSFNGTAEVRNVTSSFIYTGEQYLKDQGIPYETTWDVWQNIMALGLIAVGLMVVAYIQLRRIKKLK